MPRTRNEDTRRMLFVRLSAVAGAALILTACGAPKSQGQGDRTATSSNPPAPSEPARVQATGGSAPENAQLPEFTKGTKVIEVTMREWTFSPNPLRIPAGVPVTLVVRNAGMVPHELMAGRQPHDGKFEQDLWANVPVQIAGGSMSMAGGHDDGKQESDEKQEAGGHGGEGAHGDGGRDHGTMAMVDPGKAVYMTFTLPADRAGEWNLACFIPGHFEAGMHTKLIVE